MAEPYRRIFEAFVDGVLLCDLDSGLVIEANPAASDLHGLTHTMLVGLPAIKLVHPDSHVQFAHCIQTVRAGKTFETTLVHVRGDGTPFTVEVRGSRCFYEDRLTLLWAVRDISARVQAERLLQQQVDAHTREQSTLLEISQTLASALDLKPGLILDQLRVIIDYSHAVLFVLEDLELVALAVRGLRQEEVIPLRIRLDDPATLASLSDGFRPRRIADVTSAESGARLLRSLLIDRAAALLAGTRAWMWVPLAVKGRMIGGFGIARAGPDRFSDHDADLALTMANQAAITLVNAQLYKQAQTLATLQERQRMAQNLHDAVNQSLFSAGLIAEVLPRLWEKNPVEGRRSLEDLRRLTRGALAEMRGLLAELRPQVLVDSELGELLRQLGNAFTGRTNIPVSVTVVGQGVLPADIQVGFYRLCQEALTNIAKHARAGQVDVHLEYQAGAVEAVIRDDGQGFVPEQIPSGHYGLSMMRERAEAVGLALSVSSKPGEGTEVAIRWRKQPEENTL